MPRPRSGQKLRPGGKVSTSYRLHPETLQRVDLLADALHIDKSDVIELAVRTLAQREKLTLPPKPADE